MFVKAGHPTHSRFWLWGQQIEGNFIGGVIEGELKEAEGFLPKYSLSNEISPSYPLFITPLDPLETGKSP